MSFCPKCGTEVGGADFCSECGMQQSQPVLVKQPIHVRIKEQYHPLIIISRIRTLLDEFITSLVQPKGIISLYLLVAGFISGIYGLFFPNYWDSSLAVLGYAHMFIALITLTIGLKIWIEPVGKSQAKGMFLLALGCIILNILVMLSLYPIELIALNKFIIELPELTPQVRAHQLWGLILLGIWLFPLILLFPLYLLARYRSTKINS